MLAPMKRKLRFASVGNRNNGKSTFDNALLRNTYTETSRNDCTKSVVEMNLVPCPEEGEPTLPELVLAEIKERNSSSLDETNSDTPIDIVQRQELVKMHHGLGLAVLDCPGHDAHPECLETLECDVLICVLDAATCAIDDQLQLLEDVKKHIDKKENQPFLIVLNKIDDPDEEDLKEQAKILLNKIEQIFNVDCRETALKNLLDGAEDLEEELPPGTYPIVLKTSAKMAAKLLAINEMTEDQFKTLPSNESRKIVELSLGTHGVRDLKQEELAEKAYALSRMDGDNYALQAQYDATGFPQVFKVFERCIGGSKRQGFLASQQVHSELERVKAEPGGGYTAKFQAFQQEKAKYSAPANRKAEVEQYKTLFSAHHKLSKEKFKKKVDGADELVKCLEELELFNDISANYDADTEKWILDQPTALLHSVLQVIVRRIKAWQDCNSLPIRPVSDAAGAPVDLTRDKWEEMTIQEVILNTDAILQSLNSTPDMIDCNTFQCELSELKTIAHSFRNEETVVVDSSTKLFGWTELAEKIKKFAEKKRSEKLQRSLTQSVSLMNSDLQEENTRLHEALTDLRKENQGLTEILRKESGVINTKLDDQKQELSGIKRKLDAMLTLKTGDASIAQVESVVVDANNTVGPVE